MIPSYNFSGVGLTIQSALNGWIVRPPCTGDRTPDPLVFTTPEELSKWIKEWASDQQSPNNDKLR